ncbi:UNVERIFIED_CONTAM: hypothetical protein DV094_11980, partial [Bifidobacterium longum subsp. infantis]
MGRADREGGGGKEGRGREEKGKKREGKVVRKSMMVGERGYGNVEIVDEELEADKAVSGVGIEEAVIDEGEEGLQRNAG